MQFKHETSKILNLEITEHHNTFRPNNVNINQHYQPQHKTCQLKKSYLIARLSFSYVIFGFSLRVPHSFATFSLRTNLKTPSSWFSQQIRLGQ
jgi:hypothetical protein